MSNAKSRLKESCDLFRAMHGPMHAWPGHIALEYARLAEAADRERAFPPYTCLLCGQHITDGKPCGCGART